MNGNRPDTEVRILHTSDNHIDKISTCAALGKVVDKANELEVDLVILAGDFFDNARVKDDVVFETVRQLGRLDMPVVLLPGNHDQLDQYTIYDHPGFKDLPWQVNLLRNPEGETVLFHDLKVNVWGRPTYDHHMEFRPLQGAPPRNGPWWHVGIAHGFYVKPGEPIERSSPILAYEIEATGYDYVALGHSDFCSRIFPRAPSERPTPELPYSPRTDASWDRCAWCICTPVGGWTSGRFLWQSSLPGQGRGLQEIVPALHLKVAFQAERCASLNRDEAVLSANGVHGKGEVLGSIVAAFQERQLGGPWDEVGDAYADEPHGRAPLLQRSLQQRDARLEDILVSKGGPWPRVVSG